jgi:uncharacterized surface protein with fasciclin (FAS1) repeats
MDSKSSTGKLIGGLALVAILIVGGIYLANRSGDDSPRASTAEKTPAQDTASSRQTLVDAASSNQDFSTLVSAVKAADLVPTLSGEEKYTVFAPTNSAFEKLPAGTLDTLLKPENKEMLKGILTYHVVSGEVLSSELSNGQKIMTVNGGELMVAIEGGMVYLVDAKQGRSMVTQADIKVDNGIIHAIDTVVMPQ